MRKTIITGSICALVLFNYSNAAEETDSELKENKVCFKGVTITAQPTLNDSSIGNGTQSGKLSDSNISYEGNCMIITAPRNPSTIPVTWVQNIYTDNNANWVGSDMLGLLDPVGTPDELDFAVDVNLQFNNYTTCNHILLGLGHHGDENNWWMFFDEANHSNKSLICDYSSNETTFFVSGGGNDYTFNLKNN